MPNGIKGMKIGSIVIRCYKFDKMLAFWQEALGYAPREPAKSGWVVLRDPQGRGPNLSLQQVPEKRSGRRSPVASRLVHRQQRGRGRSSGDDRGDALPLAI